MTVEYKVKQNLPQNLEEIMYRVVNSYGITNHLFIPFYFDGCNTSSTT